jgi:DNA-binding transcriptional ArsR family regulator
MVTKAPVSPRETGDAVFAALADPSRRRILSLLARHPAAVHELSRQFRVSRPAISKHLRVLKNADLVRVQKRATENIYVLKTERLRLVESWLRQFWATRLLDLKTLAEGSWRERES